MDIIPLHIPLLISIWALGFSLFELCLCFVILLLPQETQSWVFESNMHNALYCSIFLAPAGFVALLAQLQSIEAQAAIKELESFTLSEAGCYKDIDRDAIMDLISDWWADSTSGETAQARLKQLGLHRFQSYIRFDVAPRLSQAVHHSSGRTGLCAIYLCGGHGYVLDLLAHDETGLHQAAIIIGFGAFWMAVCGPGVIKSFEVGAWVTELLIKRRRGVRSFAYVIGYCIGLSGAYLSLLAAFHVPFIGTLNEGYSLPGDGLDVWARRCAKFQTVLALHCVLAIALYHY